MAHRSTKKTNLIHWHRTAAPHDVTVAQFDRAISAGWIVADAPRTARLATDVHALLIAGVLVLWEISPSIQSTWAAFERAWRERISTHAASEIGESLQEQRARAITQRQAEIDLDALLWKFSGRGKRANSITFITAAQAGEILSALRPAEAA